jgi:DHA2 family multidrug resistance protein
VPLTGWLATRFGVVRTFCFSMLMFAVMSLACGLAPSFGFLVAARVMQGLFGGPLMPLSQSLLMQIFPKERAAAANGIWGVTTLIAPILGPILGGYICADYHWGWVFLINVPLALAGGVVAYIMLKRYEQATKQTSIDFVGLILLVVWVGALQIFLDKGKDLDWFESPVVMVLAITAIVVFGFFLIWEYYAEHPVVDIRVFHHRGFVFGAMTLFLGFAAMFAANVLTPLWLQNYMGYTSFESGKTTAWAGVLAVCTAPIVAVLATRVDPRKLVFTGLVWLGVLSLVRSVATTNMDYVSIVLPILGLGLGMPMFFVPLMSIALGNVELEEVASAAGLLSFIRTIAGAIGTSVVTTAWEDRATQIHAYLVGRTDSDGSLIQSLQSFGFSSDASLQTMDNMLQAQSVMISTNQLMLLTGFIYLAGAGMVWLAPKPDHEVDTSSVH